MEQTPRKTAVITGSTKGIGKAIALRLARESYNVVLNYATDEQAARDTQKLCQHISPHVLLIQADVSQRADIERLMRESRETFGTLDVLVNNAARVIDKSLHEMSEQDWDQVIATNLKGTFLCSQIASRYMIEQEQGGTILNIGASTGIRGRKNGVNTCASKAGIMIMTQCLALELGPKIRVNTIIPGLTRTMETEHRFHLNNPEILRAREEATHCNELGRLMILPMLSCFCRKQEQVFSMDKKWSSMVDNTCGKRKTASSWIGMHPPAKMGLQVRLYCRAENDLIAWEQFSKRRSPSSGEIAQQSSTASSSI